MPDPLRMSVWQPRPRSKGMTKRAHPIRKKLNEMPHFVHCFGKMLNEIAKKPDETLHFVHSFGKKLNEMARKPNEMPHFVHNFGKRLNEMARKSDEMPHFVHSFGEKLNEMARKPDEMRHFVQHFAVLIEVLEQRFGDFGESLDRPRRHAEPPKRGPSDRRRSTEHLPRRTGENVEKRSEFQERFGPRIEAFGRTTGKALKEVDCSLAESRALVWIGRRGGIPVFPRKDSNAEPIVKIPSLAVPDATLSGPPNRGMPDPGFSEPWAERRKPVGLGWRVFGYPRLARRQRPQRRGMSWKTLGWRVFGYPPSGSTPAPTASRNGLKDASPLGLDGVSAETTFGSTPAPTASRNGPNTQALWAWMVRSWSLLLIQRQRRCGTERRVGAERLLWCGREAIIRATPTGLCPSPSGIPDTVTRQRIRSSSATCRSSGESFETVDSPMEQGLISDQTGFHRNRGRP
jgi:hypothetical protein